MSVLLQNLTATVLTVSDSAARGERSDLSGPAVADLLTKNNFAVSGVEVVADDQTSIAEALVRLSANARFVVTTGGTGVAERDVTPEATRSVCSRILEGVAEHMRAEGMKKTRNAVLSRGICGVRGHSVILNLPGSPAGAIQSLESVIDIVPHIIQLLAGDTRHD
jgi:molybdopterin adenylyltransferase